MMTGPGTALARFEGAALDLGGRPLNMTARIFTFPFWMTVLTYAHGLRVEDEDSIWWERLAVAVAAGWWILLAFLIAYPAR